MTAWSGDARPNAYAARLNIDYPERLDRLTRAELVHAGPARVDLRPECVDERVAVAVVVAVSNGVPWTSRLAPRRPRLRP